MRKKSRSRKKSPVLQKKKRSGRRKRKRNRTLLLPLSNYFLLTEQSFYTALYSVALLWSGFLLLVGTLVTHQYSLGKTVVMLLCIVAAMCMLAYIALLYLDLVWQVIGFITTLLREASMRR